MTNEEILEEVYKMCCNPFERWGYSRNLPMSDVKSFIEQEWLKQDEHGESKWRQANHPRADSNPHRELVIGEDGTVKELKG